MKSVPKQYYEKTDESIFTNDEYGSILDDLRTGAMRTVTKSSPKKLKKSLPTSIKESKIPEIKVNNDGIVNIEQSIKDFEDILYEEDQDSLVDELYTDLREFNSILTPDELRNALLGVLHDLAQEGTNDLIFVKHDTARMFYEKYIQIANKIQTAADICTERKTLREKALGKLTIKEREILGI